MTSISDRNDVDATVRARGRGGFVLVLVLVSMGIVAAGAIVLSGLAGSGDRASLAALAGAEARAAADAGIARALHAFARAREAGASEAGLGGAPLPAGPWRFAGAAIETAVVSEGGKADLNAGDGALVAAFLAGAGVRDPLLTAAAATLAEHRAAGAALPSVAALLPACERLSADRRRLEAALTVLTRAAGVAPGRVDRDRLARLPGVAPADLDRLAAAVRDGRSPLDDDRLAHLHRVLADPAPTDTLTVTVHRPGTAELVKVVALRHEIGRRIPAIVEDRAAPAVDVSLCGTLEVGSAR